MLYNGNNFGKDGIGLAVEKMINNSQLFQQDLAPKRIKIKILKIFLANLLFFMPLML